MRRERIAGETLHASVHVLSSCDRRMSHNPNNNRPEFVVPIIIMGVEMSCCNSQVMNFVIMLFIKPSTLFGYL